MNPFEKYVNETFEALNERSINKINKEFTETVNKMAEKATEYKEAEGAAKDAILAELKELTAKKKELTKELDSAVAGKDKNVQLVVNERNLTLKRRYTENHPAITVGKGAKIRNKVLEAIKDGKITQEEFDNIVSELSNNSKRWARNNAKYFTISEDGISLSKFGQKILAGITVNEGKVSEDEIDTIYIEGTFKDGGEFYEDQETTDVEWVKKNYRKITKDLKSSEIFIRMNNGDEISYAEYKKQVNEATKENPEVWVPGEFDKAISKLPNSKIDMATVSKLARKHGVDLDDAIKYVEFGWDMDLNENKTSMKTKFIYESFGDFVNSLNESAGTLNEAFASTKLASILTGGNKMDKDLPKAFYNMSKIALDKIQDVDIIEMDPATAKKEKRANAIYMYFTTNAKENPYAGNSAWREEKEIPANTLLAITNGQNEWMATEWQRSYSRSKDSTKTLKVGKREDAAGFKKSGKGEYNSGISSMKQVSELADRAYVLDLDILRARYSTVAKRNERSAAQKGAVAFQNDKDFKAENLSRYNTIIADRAAKMPIDKMVADAIDTISKQIKDALVKGEKGRYGEIVVGRNKKGNEGKLSDAARHMQNILDEFQRYVNDTNQAEVEKKAGYDGDYYAGRVKQSAKEITDKIKQVETFGYVW